MARRESAGLLQAGHLLDGLDGKGHGAAHGHARHQAGIVVGKEAAGHIAGDVQAGHGLVVGVQRLALFVDGDALLGGQQRSAQPTAVERRFADGAQAVGRLAEVGVLLGVVQLVVALDGSQEVFLVLAGEAQLVGQLLDGVDAEEAACSFGFLHLGQHIVGAAVAGLGRAADGVEPLHVLIPVVVVDLGVDTARLMGCGVDDVVVGAALVGKAQAVAVHLQEGLGAGVILADGAGESLAAEGAFAFHIAGVLSRRHHAAVEQHGRGLLVQVGARPDGGADAVAAVGRRVGAGGGDAGAQGVQLFHHVGVAGVAAAGQQDALGRVDADEVAVVVALGDDAGNAAAAVLFQLGQGGVEVDGVAQLLDVVLESLVALHTGSGLRGHVVVLLDGVEVIGVVLGVLCGPGGLGTGGELAGPAVLAFQDAGHKVVHGGGLVDPGLDHTLVALAGSIAGDLAQQLGAVAGLGAGCLGGRGINGAVPVTGILHGHILLDDTEIQAVLCGVSGSAHTAVARAHDDDVGVPGLGDGGLVDVGLGAQPVVLVAAGQLHRGDHRFALGLGIAALGRLHDGVGGDGRAGHAVDLGGTGFQQLLAQLVGGGRTVGSGLAGGVHHHVGDGGLREGHGDLDGGGNALCGALIGAGDVGGAGRHRARARRNGAGRSRAGRFTGGQRAGGDAAHGRSRGDLEETFAGNLVHGGSFSFLLFSLRVRSHLPCPAHRVPGHKTENPRRLPRAGFPLLLYK